MSRFRTERTRGHVESFRGTLLLHSCPLPGGGREPGGGGQPRDDSANALLLERNPGCHRVLDQARLVDLLVAPPPKKKPAVANQML